MMAFSSHWRQNGKTEESARNLAPPRLARSTRRLPTTSNLACRLMMDRIPNSTIGCNRIVQSHTYAQISRRRSRCGFRILCNGVAMCLFISALTETLSANNSIRSSSQVAPSSVLHRELQRHRGEPTSASLLSKSDKPLLPLQKTKSASGLTGTVFGFLPYWSSSEHLRYDLLTHIACAAVEVNGDGSLGNDHGWPWMGVINTAHQNGVRIVLVAALFGSTELMDLLTDPTNKATFFANIHSKMLEGGADGLNIDFEGSGTQWQPYMPAFMADLSTYLYSVQPGCQVTVDGPAVNWSGAWDLDALAASCDGVFIMGYDFYGSWSATTGPVAPLTGGSFNITNTVQSQYAAVLQSNPQKLILGVPYYGAHWTTSSSSPRSAVTGWVGSVTFASAMPQSQSYGLQWDSVSQTPWYRWHDGVTWHQVWFDNGSSIGRKYDLAIASGFQGVGMWALGYDGDRDELWDVIESRFLVQPSPEIPALSPIGLVGLGLCIVFAGMILVARAGKAA